MSMPTLPSISKPLLLGTLVLWLTACHTQAQPPLFLYRGLYSPSNTPEVQRASGLCHPDYDWGLWGHNLKKVVGPSPTPDMKALVDGKRTDRQFCFSSPALFRAVCTYIDTEYGPGDATYSERISIMPQDNKLVCTCSRCKALGNTPQSATPSVTHFVTRLARRYPRHQFFTSAYHTTTEPPRHQLPPNVGVFISSYPLQMRVDPSKGKGYAAFVSVCEAWKQRCRHVYVWDYERNYDDYLTPFPCLLALQSRLRLYRQLGIEGLFVNGSGDDYSTFDDLHTHLLAQLMADPDTDVHQAIAHYFQTFYPQTAHLLTDYYWSLEERARETNHLLPLYGTIEDVCQSYLDPAAFLAFRRQLEAAKEHTTGDERRRLNTLLTALAFTQLQLYRSHLIPPAAAQEAEMRAILRGHREIPHMNSYDERGHQIDDYLKHLSE